MTSNTIKFVLGNKIHVIHNPDPNETILNYIRLKLKKTGTKEGCAEGGCGACTVVLGELEKNNIIYKAINSCIAFVPILEGKQLLIVEDLILKNGSLHPVQNAMVPLSWITMWFLHTWICNVFICNVQKSFFL